MKTIHSILAVALAVSALPALAQDPPPPAPQAPAPRGQFEKGRRGFGGGPFKDLLESLTPAERKQYMEARKKTRNDSAVMEARKKVEEAQQALADATKAAMLKADPTLSPVLEKVEAAIKEKKEEMQERRNNMRLP